MLITKKDINKTPDTTSVSGSNLRTPKIELLGIDQVYKTKREDIVVFDKFDFVVDDIPDAGQFIVILGTSGCGKSTLLRYIAGLQHPTDGIIKINGEIKADDHRTGMVFQQYSNLPWYSVLKNVSLPLIFKGVDKQEIEERAMEVIKLVGLDGHEKKYAKAPNLSGGQLQRVAIARNIVDNREVLLMDEPFGALDIKTRLDMQNLIADIFTKMPGDPTILFVTHSIEEAVYLADEIFILDANPGRIVDRVTVDLGYYRDFTTKRLDKFNKLVYEIEDKMLKLENHEL